MPSSWQRQGAGQAGRGPGWGAHGEAQSAAQSQRARSPGALGIAAAGRAAGTGGAQSERSRHRCAVFTPGFHGLGLAGEGGARELSRLSLPFPPSLRAGRNFIQERKKQTTLRAESGSCRRLGCGLRTPCQSGQPRGHRGSEEGPGSTSFVRGHPLGGGAAPEVQLGVTRRILAPGEGSEGLSRQVGREGPEPRGGWRSGGYRRRFPAEPQAPH